MARLRYWNIVQFVPWILRTQITLISGPDIVSICMALQSPKGP